MVTRLLAWATRNERHLGALVFVLGFVTDVIGLTVLTVSTVLTISALYGGIAALAVFLGHALHTWRESSHTFQKTVMVLLPLIAQYFIGNLLSWLLIFYTKSAALAASWPFILLLALVFLGNEVFRKYKDRIAFITVLLFFTLYAYAIFVLPIMVHAMGPLIFLGSTVLSLVLFGIYVYLLYVTGKDRIRPGLGKLIGSVGAVTVMVVTSYVTGIIPPLPLTLSDNGIYHTLSRSGDSYVLQAEAQKEWWDIRPQTIHIVSGEPVYAFASIVAPTKFGTVVVHRWQQYNDTDGAWVTKSRIAFPITGGREGGYRGYSEYSHLTPGAWRVRIETENGQVIGQVRFTAVAASEVPSLHTETK